MPTSDHLAHQQLSDLLKSGSPPPGDPMLEHLDRCVRCQSRLEQLAADQQWWTKANSHLSTVDSQSPARSAGSSSVVAVVGVDSGDGSGDDGSYSSLLGTPTHPEMLGRVDQFEVAEVIGRGGMGVVFKGFDHGLNRSVAIKFLAPHLASSGVARQRFEREARAAAAVRHPNVVPIHAIHAGAHPYLVMQLVTGPSLQTYVREHGPLGVKDTVRIAMQIADGLAAAHDQGMIHRDVKPANVLVDGDISRVMITDFGLARAVDDVVMTQTGWLAGTPHYMSPEQARGEELDHRSDLFSLGSLMYFLATGREPFRAEQPLAVLRKITSRAHTPARNVNAEVPAALSRIIDILLEKKPSARFESAHDLKRDLQRYLAHLQHPQSHRRPRRRWSSRDKRIAGLASAIMVIGALVAGLVWSATGRTSAGRGATHPPISASATDNAHEALEPATDQIPPFAEYLQKRLQLEAELTLFEQQVKSGRSAGSFENRIDRLDRDLEGLRQRTWTEAAPVLPPSTTTDG